jgi:hypothetical protein
MPESKKIPSIDDDTPGAASVYIKNKSTGSVGRCTVDQWRDLYEPSGKWELATPDEFAEHDRKLAAELRDMQINAPDALYPPEGATAAQRATSRTSSSKEG